MVLCEVIGWIAVFGTPKNVKLTLAYMVADPIKVHLNGFGTFMFDGVIGNATGHAIVSL